MTLRRGLAWFFVLVGVFLICCLSYLAFVDLGRHKGRIESLVSQYTGREFAIEGELKFELFPSISLVAENVRLANADWASKQPMVRAGRLAANVGLWSLISGPVDVRSIELRDVDVLLERGRGDRANWIFKESTASGETAPESDGTPLPLVIEKATLRNVQVTYRERGKRDRIGKLEKLTIASGNQGLLSLEGRGQLNEYPFTIDGDAGPLASLLKGRDIRMDMKASLGRLVLDIEGGFGRLVPLQGANLKIKATGEDVDAMLARLELPLIATGALRIDATLADAGKLTRFAVEVTAGDLSGKASGTLTGLQLRGSDVKFEATAADAARLAGVFGVEGIPAAPLAVSGRVTTLRKEIRFEELRAQLAGATARLDGKLLRDRKPKSELRFDVGIENLSQLRTDLPPLKLSARGNFVVEPERLAITDLAANIDENAFSGQLSSTRVEPRRFDVDLSSPHIDLTRYFPATPPPDVKSELGAATKSKPEKPPSDAPKRKYLFSEDPLPMRELSGTEAKLHVAVAELVLANKSLKDVEGTVEVDRAQVTVSARARGSLEGTMNGSITVKPVDDHSASMNLELGIEKIRAGLDMKEMKPDEVPPVSVEVRLETSGSSARQLASNANGHIVLTQGPGKTKSQFLDAFGGNVLSELRSRLNPFKAQDPFTQLDCSVLRADIVDGGVTVKPVLLQTLKVTVVAQGKIDLHTENLTLDFDTRPRKGIGVSPGMFTNPFIRVEGTLTNPRLAVGAKGMTSGAVAAATGGLSVLAGGLIDRLKGGTDMCRKALDLVQQQATPPTR